MKLKIPPIVIVFFTGLLMWGVNHLTREHLSFIFDQQQLMSRVLFGLCIICVAAGLYAFYKLKTTVDPMNPDHASNLVTIGIYHFTRNPMYLGMFWMLAAWGVKLGNPLNFLWLIFFVSYMTRFQIRPEEEALGEKFGTSYQEYCKKVRRWI
ncbi:MAG: isoprenylcysteine carboxylmethyltransferase family protein [Cyclobacteriaceae bacterium]